MTRPRPHTTIVAGVTVFLAVLVLLAWQVRSGRDPALGVSKTAQVAAAPRRVLVRKIVRRVIVTQVIQTDDGPQLVSASVPVTSGGGSGGTVVQSAPSVSYSAPAPAAAPAAPVVTKTS